MRTKSGAAQPVHVTSATGPDARKGARLCVSFAAKTFCYTATANGKPFRLEPVWKPIAVIGNPPSAGYLLFTALGEPFFSRQDKHLSLLVLDSVNGLRNVLPPLVLSEQSEYSIWQDPQFSPLPIVTTAEFHWDMEHETHFGPHRYRIDTYVADSDGQYVLKDTYLTDHQYPGLDEASRVVVLESEMKAVRQHLTEK
jgi:hypothetical protein